MKKIWWCLLHWQKFIQVNISGSYCKGIWPWQNCCPAIIFHHMVLDSPLYPPTSNDDLRGPTGLSREQTDQADWPSPTHQHLAPQLHTCTLTGMDAHTQRLKESTFIKWYMVRKPVTGAIITVLPKIVIIPMFVPSLKPSSIVKINKPRTLI